MRLPFAASIVDQAGESLGRGLPGIAAALVLLVVGVIVVRILARLLVRMLRRVGFDELAERAKVHDALSQAGLPRSASKVLGTVVRIALTLVVVFAALSLVGLAFLSDSLNAAVLFLPVLLVALALLLAGVVLGGVAREGVDRLAYQMNLPDGLGRVAQFGVMAIFAVTALTQIGVATLILMLLVGVLLVAAALTFALAFGLGGREVARAVGAGRFVRDSYAVGQEISVGGFAGTIEELEATGIVLRTASGTTLRVPHHMLLESIVEIRGEAPEAPPEPIEPAAS